MKVEIETDDYSENFNFELIWKDEIDIKMDNILNNYNSAKALITEIEELKLIYEKQSIHELLADYADIIYNDIKS